MKTVTKLQSRPQQDDLLKGKIVTKRWHGAQFINNGVFRLKVKCKYQCQLEHSASCALNLQLLKRGHTSHNVQRSRRNTTGLSDLRFSFFDNKQRWQYTCIVFVKPVKPTKVRPLVTSF